MEGGLTGPRKGGLEPQPRPSRGIAPRHSRGILRLHSTKPMGLTDAVATWAGPPLPAFVEDLSLQRPGMGLVAIQCAEKGREVVNFN